MIFNKKILWIPVVLVALFGVVLVGVYRWNYIRFNVSPVLRDMPEIHVAYSTNDTYAEYLGVSVTSLLWHNRSARVHVYVLNETLSAENKAYLSKVVTYFPNADLTFLPVSVPDEFGVLLDYLTYLSKDTFSRIFLPELLPHLDKILYLDVDVVVNGSLLPLYQTDISDKALGAVVDLNENTMLFLLKKYNLKQYVCAGELLMNLKYMRENRVSKRLYDFLYDNLNNPTIRWADQDAINIVLEHEIKRLPGIWFADARQRRGFDTVVLHYAACKPWKVDHMQGFYWDAYANMTKRILDGQNPYPLLIWDYTWLKLKQAAFVLGSLLLDEKII